MRLEGACLDSVYGGVVPIAIQARDLAVRVEAYDVSVGDPSDLTLFYEVRDIRRHRSTDQRLHYDGVLFGLDHLDDFGPEVGDGLRKAAPNLFKAATDWHDTVLAVGGISSLSPVSANGEHAVDVMRVIGGEECLSDRFQISIHVASVSVRRMSMCAAQLMVRTIRNRACPAIILAYASAAFSSGMVSTMAMT